MKQFELEDKEIELLKSILGNINLNNPKEVLDVALTLKSKLEA